MSVSVEEAARPGSEARCAVLQVLHKMQGVATLPVLVERTGYQRSTVEAAVRSLLKDHWIGQELIAGRKLFRLTPAMRKAYCRAFDSSS